MADAPDLGSGSERIGGSSPLARTTFLGHLEETDSPSMTRAELLGYIGATPGGGPSGPLHTGALQLESQLKPILMNL